LNDQALLLHLCRTEFTLLGGVNLETLDISTTMATMRLLCCTMRCNIRNTMHLPFAICPYSGRQAMMGREEGGSPKHQKETLVLCSVALLCKHVEFRDPAIYASLSHQACQRVFMWLVRQGPSWLNCLDLEYHLPNWECRGVFAPLYLPLIFSSRNLEALLASFPINHSRNICDSHNASTS
jgi:hypothetical protein